MTLTIWKYCLLVGNSSLALPATSTILTAQVQDDEIMLWVLVDPASRTRTRKIRVVPTGTQLTADVGTYVATVQTGALVWHVFDLGFTS